MEEKKLPELIDEYLLCRINDADLAALERLRNSDPRKDRHFKKNRIVFMVLQYLRYSQLREKLRRIDLAMTKKISMTTEACVLPFYPGYPCCLVSDIENETFQINHTNVYLPFYMKAV